MKSFKHIFFVLLMMYLLGGCNKSTDNENFPETDIVYTDADGNISGADDTDDWQPRAVAPDFHFGPAFPNPVTGDEVTIPYSIPDSIHKVTLIIADSENQLDTIRTLVNENQQPGYFQVIWNLQDNQNLLVTNGLYRAKIEITSNDTTYCSYGDIKIE